MEECKYCGLNVDNGTNICTKCEDLISAGKKEDRIEFKFNYNGRIEKRYILKSEWDLFNKFYRI